MNWDDDDDSVFEQALRADLPTMSQQNRMRQRLLAAGVAAGTALGTNVAAATQAGFGASALSKLSALSWPAKLGLTALLAAPVAALPLVYTPVRGAAIVSQVRSSAATVRARSAAKTLSHAQLLPLEAAPIAEPEPEPESEPSVAPAKDTARAIAIAPMLAAAPIPSPTAGNASPAQAAVAAVAAFDAPAPSAPASESEQPHIASTLAAETQLLDRAFAALSAGDRGTAAALVAEHARRFPNGLLRQERERARARLAADPKGE